MNPQEELEFIAPVEVQTNPAPKSFAIMPRANSTQKLDELTVTLDSNESAALKIQIEDGDTAAVIKAKAKQARELRLGVFRPTRVLAEKLHKELKAEVLIIGRELDAAKNKIASRCERMEDHLTSIEKELERREQEAADARYSARLEAITPYTIEGLPLPQWPDDDEKFAAILTAQKSAHGAWKAQLEADRIAKEEAARKEEEERKAAEAKHQQELEEARKAKAEADAKLAKEREARRKEQEAAAEQRRKDEAAREEERKKQEAELEKIRQEAEAKLAKGREEFRKQQEEADRQRKKEQEEAEAKAAEQRKAIELRAQKRQRAKEQLYFACDKFCNAALTARFYCPEEVQQTIDDAVKHWKDIQSDLQ